MSGRIPGISDDEMDMWIINAACDRAGIERTYNDETHEERMERLAHEDDMSSMEAEEERRSLEDEMFSREIEEDNGSL